jgi:hypothetical protein
MSPVFAVAALLFTAIALIGSGEYRGGPHAAIELVFDAVAHVTFQSPENKNLHQSVALSLARILVVLFGLTTSLAVVFTLSRPASDGWLRLTFWFARRFRHKRPAVIVGLGAVLLPLVQELCDMGPVYAIDRRADGSGVDDARKLGALVITGDATDRKIRAAVDLVNAGEIFIWTGDDLQNLQIAAGFAADVAGSLRGRRREDPVKVYVQTAEAPRSGTLEGYGLLRGRIEGFDVVPFSRSELAARDLFFEAGRGLAVTSQTVPGPGEVFHVFAFGFGATGQAISLAVSRFAHFVPRVRPRMTIYVDAGEEEQAERFTACHPTFAPSDLDLSSPTFLAAGDGWDARPSRPSAKTYQREPHEEVTSEGVVRRVRPVEYGVNAEFRVLPGELEAGPLVAELAARLRPPAGPPVRACAVLCLEESRRNFRGALQLREALARHLLNDASDQETAESQAPILPIHIYLPEDASLATLVGERPDLDAGELLVQRAFPFRVFGQPADMTSYAAITRGPFLNRAAGLKGTYDIMSGRAAAGHPDFDDSNLDAALHAELIKFPAMGLVFLRTPSLDDPSASTRGLHPAPLLANLSRPDVVAEAEQLIACGRIFESGRLEVSPETMEAVTPLVRQRLAILDQIHVPAPANGDTEHDKTLRWKLHELIRQSVNETVGELDRELCARGRQLDTFAEMEHNRWMGERFAKGWSFGARSDIRRQRPSFVPWRDLSEFDRQVDRAQVARLIVGHAARGEYAYLQLTHAGAGQASSGG